MTSDRKARAEGGRQPRRATLREDDINAKRTVVRHAFDTASLGRVNTAAAPMAGDADIQQPAIAGGAKARAAAKRGAPGAETD